MDSNASMTSGREPPDAELIMRRLFRVAEILSRTSLHEPATENRRENDTENHENKEVGYCESDERSNNS
jgi:hypothetical protein